MFGLWKLWKPTPTQQKQQVLLGRKKDLTLKNMFIFHNTICTNCYSREIFLTIKGMLLFKVKLKTAALQRNCVEASFRLKRLASVWPSLTSDDLNMVKNRKKVCHLWYPWMLSFLLIYTIHMFQNANYSNLFEVERSKKVKSGSWEVIWFRTEKSLSHMDILKCSAFFWYTSCIKFPKRYHKWLFFCSGPYDLSWPCFDLFF